jgi:hypothetical protein
MQVLAIEVGQDENGRFPLCPYCEEELSFIKVYRSHFKFLSNLHVFACPHCRKALNASAVSK